ncbi:MAG: hypothetical protein ACJARG_000060 [Arcticibacterium sp.]|jgi:hypothetical protein
MFIDEKTQIEIHADLDCTVIHATFRRFDLIPDFLDVIKDTPEYLQINIPSSALEDEDSEYWDTEDSLYLLDKLFDTLDHYAPDGYYFGCTEGNFSDFGFWKNEEEE